MCRIDVVLDFQPHADLCKEEPIRLRDGVKGGDRPEAEYV